MMASGVPSQIFACFVTRSSRFESTQQFVALNAAFQTYPMAWHGKALDITLITTYHMNTVSPTVESLRPFIFE